MFGFVHVESCAQGVVGRANAEWLVDADLISDGQMQRQMEVRVLLPAVVGEFLLHCRLEILYQSVVSGKLRERVGSGSLVPS